MSSNESVSITPFMGFGGLIIDPNPKVANGSVFGEQVNGLRRQA